MGLQNLRGEFNSHYRFMTKEQFVKELVKSMKENDLSDRDVAGIITVAPFIVRRWIEGKSEPHPAMMKAIIELVNKPR